MKRLLLVALCFLCSLHNAHAQGSPDKDPKPAPAAPGVDPVPATPQAAESVEGFSLNRPSFLGYSPASAAQNTSQNIPVNYYTGTPQISIPFYILQEGGISIPVVLGFDASGMRVSEPAGWCGQGWALQAGGMISRIVRGYPDEGSLVEGVVHKGYYQVGWNSSSQQDDHEPDIYLANLNGVTYRFMLDENREFTCQPAADVRIKAFIKTNRNNSQVLWFSGFEIITPDGIKYVFGSEQADASDFWEFSITKDAKQGSPNLTNGSDDSKTVHPIGWPLRKIKAPFQRDITFQYVRSSYAYYQVGDAEASSNGTVTQRINRVWVQSYVLREIDASNVKVLFNKDVTTTSTIVNPETGDTETTISTESSGAVLRQDLMDFSTGNPNAYGEILKTVHVIDKASNKEIIYNLNYEYYDCEEALAWSGYTLNSSRLKRLKLKSLSFPTGEALSFYYHYESSPFPGVTSRGVDHWGYANGAVSSPNRIGNGAYQATTFSDRSAQEGWSHYGNLAKITSSSGIETSFDYECHSASNYGSVIGGSRIKQIASKDIVTNQYMVKRYEYKRPDESPSGFLILEPVYRFDFPSGGYGYNSYLYPMALSYAGRAPISYRYVRELIYSGQDINSLVFQGKTLYTYNQNETAISSDIFSHQPWEYKPFFAYGAMQSGALEKTETYTRDNKLISVSEYRYSTGPSIATFRSINHLKFNGVQGISSNYGDPCLRFSAAEEKIRTYADNGLDNIEQIIRYKYKDEMDNFYTTIFPGKHQFPIYEQTIDARGKQVETWTSYVGDFDFGTTIQSEQICAYNDNTGSTGPECYTINVQVPNVPNDQDASQIAKMRLANQLAMPIEIYTKRDGKVISGQYTNYIGKEGSEQGLVHEQYSLKNIDLNDFYFVRWNGSNIQRDGRYLLLSTNEFYNNRGLVTSSKINFGPRTMASYTANDLLPYEVKQAAGLPEEQRVLTEYSVPLFGVEKITLPNNLTRRNEYEQGTGRLQRVRDHNNNIIKELEYRRRGQ